jgi:hypothetical protein
LHLDLGLDILAVGLKARMARTLESHLSPNDLATC